MTVSMPFLLVATEGFCKACEQKTALGNRLGFTSR